MNPRITLQDPSPAVQNSSYALQRLIAEMGHCLGVNELPPTADGHFELVLDGTRSFSIWQLPDLSGVLMMADLPIPQEVDRDTAQHRALSFCLGAATTGAPMIGMDDDGELSLLWVVASGEGDDFAQAAVTEFLESLADADAMLAGTPFQEAAIHPAESQQASPINREVLAAVAAFFELETVSFDEAGFAAFQAADDGLVLLQHLPALQRMAVMAQVGAVSEGDSQIYQAALEYNFSAVPDRQPPLGLDADAGGLFLITHLGATASAISEVEPTLELFASQYASCKGEVFDPDYLDDYLATESEEASATADEQDLNFTGLRV